MKEPCSRIFRCSPLLQMISQNWWKRIHQARNRTLRVFLELFLLLILTGSVFIVTLKVTENLSWLDAAWQVWQTAATVGYGDIPTRTPAGKLATIFLGMFTIGVLGTTVSTLFDYREERKNRRRFGMIGNPHKNGIVLFHFPGVSKFLDFERELRFYEPDVGICIIDNKIEELPTEVCLLPKIHFVRGSIIEETTYKMANLKENRIIIVFPADPSNPESDATTKVAVSLIREFVGKQTRIVYVLVDRRNFWMFKDIDCHATSILDSLEVLALVQECQDPYTAPALQQLLVNTEGGPMPQTVVPKAIIGWTWGDLVRHAVPAARALSININFFSLVKGGVPNICPYYSTVIEEGDHISVIAAQNVNRGEFEDELLMAKR